MARAFGEGSVSVLAVIPARCADVSVQGGPLLRIGGWSLLERSIRVAIGCALIDRVLVCTDDDTIAAAARALGAEVYEPAAHAAAGLPALVAELLELAEGVPDTLMLLNPAAPFLDPDDLGSAIARVASGKESGVFAATELSAAEWRPGLADEPLAAGVFLVVDVTDFRRAGAFGRLTAHLVDPVRATVISSTGSLAIAAALVPLADRPIPIDVDALITDFDGVHTDDRVSIGGDGAERVTTSRADAAGIELLHNAGYPMLILSRETNRVVTARGRRLGMDVRQGLEDKATVLAAWARARGIELDRIAYVGNDVGDLACMALVGWPIAVADANPHVLAVARVVLDRPGGHGAIREVAMRILEAGPRARVSISGDVRTRAGGPIR